MKKRAIDNCLVKELALLMHIYMLLSKEVNPEMVDKDFEKEVEKIIKKLQNISFIYKRYWDLSEREFKKRWFGIDKESREKEYQVVSYALHLLFLYKYNWKNKKIGKALFSGINEELLLEVFNDMERKKVKKEDIYRSMDFAEKVYNKLKEGK